MTNLNFPQKVLVGTSFAIIFLLTSCSETTDQLPQGGIVFSLMQRMDTTISVNGTDLQIAIDDITGGRVMLSVQEDEEVFDSAVLSEGEEFDFNVNDDHYTIECIMLNNQLIGNDRGTFRLKERSELNNGAKKDTEKEINELLEKIKTSGYTFIRNGERHSAAEAAEHLKTKYDAAKDQITSKEQFIKEIATKSKMSGEYYLLEINQDSTIKLADWLRKN